MNRKQTRASNKQNITSPFWREFLPDMKSNQAIARKTAPIWTLGDITKRIKPIPMGGLSADDAVIYEKT